VERESPKTLDLENCVLEGFVFSRNDSHKSAFLVLSVICLCGPAQGLSHQEQQAQLLNLINNIQPTVGDQVQLDQVPAKLSKEFRANFMLKYGQPMKADGQKMASRPGARGHKPEEDIEGMGIHASPSSPRVYVFDPKTGQTISYNGGAKNQVGSSTLDLMTFEEKTSSFHFGKIDFPISKGKAVLKSNTCVACHGGAAGEKQRPIFSMYPDWPRFFGSDNDELKLGRDFPTEASIPKAADSLTKQRIQLQQMEWTFFEYFKKQILPGNKRYEPLFDVNAFNVHGYQDLKGNKVAMSDYEEYPYRPDAEDVKADGSNAKLDKSDPSRAFARRAGLRFNLLQSRLLVRQVVDQITKHSNFKEYGNFFVYNMMRCAPESLYAATGGNRQIRSEKIQKLYEKWSPKLSATLKAVADQGVIKYKYWDNNWKYSAANQSPLLDEGSFNMKEGLKFIGQDKVLLEYGQNLALFGLKINDVDMRFTYYHEDYRPSKAFRTYKNIPEGAMQVGYLEDTYFNSYNDGSTTMDEHLTSRMLAALAKQTSAEHSFKDKSGKLKAKVTLAEYLKFKRPLIARGLLDKYSGEDFEKRLVTDRVFFKRMDELSTWFSLPYPYKAGDQGKSTSFIELHHRAPFHSGYREAYDEVCKYLEAQL